jgi:Fe-S-cluster containining protein
MDEEFLCVRCARRRKTCCQICEIYVTPGDVERIESHADRDDFYEFRLPDNQEYADQDDDPVWRDHVFRPDGSRRVLKRRPDGDCTFLGPHGCVLPLEVRPLVCRIYPYDYSEEGILPELSEGCPLELLRPDQGLIEALAMNLEDARRWRDQLYEEIRLEHVEEERPVLAGRPDV